MANETNSTRDRDARLLEQEAPVRIRLKVSIAVWFLATVSIQLFHRSIPESATIVLFLIGTTAMFSAVVHAKKYRRIQTAKTSHRAN